MSAYNDNFELWSSLVKSSFLYWKKTSIDKRRYLNEIIKYYNNGSASLYIFHKGNVTNITKDKTNRNPYYWNLFKRFANFANTDQFVVLPFFIGDRGINSENGPFFSFQKQIWQNSILLPDIDMVANNFYSDISNIDLIDYDQKLCKGTFVGSTTGGGKITLEKIDSEIIHVPRLRSCKYFENNDLVDFTLPQITQCDNDEVKDYIRSNFKTGAKLPWSAQLKYRFIISIDGNGATCSRVSKTLLSNSVLLKYNSESILFFFHLLKPWIHYIPIEKDEDVTSVIQTEINNPGFFREITINAQQVSKQYFQAHSVYTYVDLVLKSLESTISFTQQELENSEFHELIQSKVIARSELILSGHLSSKGDSTNYDNVLGVRSGHYPIELLKYECSGSINVNSNDIQIRAHLSDGTITDFLNIGQEIGTRGKNISIIGLEIQLSEFFSSQYVFLCSVEFLDRSAMSVDSISENKIVLISESRQPLVFIQSSINRRTKNVTPDV